MDERQSHPTAKPVALVADAIRDCTRRGGTGSLESCKLVALGREDFAIADASTMMNWAAGQIQVSIRR
jgi:hypothetical protein